MPVPEAIQNAPDLWLGLDLYYSAYLDLDSCRSNGFERGSISWFDIRQYCVLQELDEDQTNKMHLVIPMMDKEHYSFLSEKRKRNKEVKKDG